MLLRKLSEAPLLSVVRGKAVTQSILAKDLWKSNSVLFFVVRRPGCALCREDALDLATRFKNESKDRNSKLFGKNIDLVGIIKEVAPARFAPSDAELGVEVFQTQYFLDYPVFLDSNKAFYSFLGNRSLWNQKVSLNPFKVYSAYKEVMARLDQKIVKGNLLGEGILQGGVLIVDKDPEKGCVYLHQEHTGYELPLDEIFEYLYKLE